MVKSALWAKGTGHSTDGAHVTYRKSCWWAPQIRAGDVVRWPYGAVETAPIDERDIAAVAVRALSEASLAGGDYVLTGPAAVGHPAYVTTTVADLTGAPARSFREWFAAHADSFRNAGGEGAVAERWHWSRPTVDLWGEICGLPAVGTTWMSG